MIEHNEKVKVQGKISELRDTGKQSLTPYNVLINNNMGNTTLIMSLPIVDFVNLSEVANKKNISETTSLEEEPIAQRPLDITHASRLSFYMMKGLIKHVNEVSYKGKKKPQVLEQLTQILGKQPYVSIQPVTCNIRNCEPNGGDLDYEITDGKVTAYLAQKHRLWVIDGQHRRYAAEMLMEFLKSVRTNLKYPARPKIITPADIGRTHVGAEELEIWEAVYEIARTKSSINVEVHLGLVMEEERQLFHDLNNLTKKVESGLAYSYDSTNPVNQFIKDYLDKNSFKPSITDRDLKEWSEDDGRITRKDLVAINSILFLNKTNSKSAKNNQVKLRINEAQKFWEHINNMPGFGEDGFKGKSILGQPVALKAIAKLAYELTWSAKYNNEEGLKKLYTHLKTIDFSHKNQMWNYYNLDKDNRLNLFPGLEKYLPPEDDSNRDMGFHDGHYMRFGSKHNDIFPLIGDMIRWKLDLPNRNLKKHEKVKDAA